MATLRASSRQVPAWALARPSSFPSRGGARERTPRYVTTVSAPRLAAYNFKMPALSPTMTEGNVAAWRVGQGDVFVAGDVLLEIETDKATMDVEAQEDGIMMRIVRPAGERSVPVGARIAVIAEPGDDLATLEIPPEDPAAKTDTTPAPAVAPPPPATPKSDPAPPAKQPRRPLLPSVAQLVSQHGLDDKSVASIAGTGPGRRLLKGDVLAHVGTIPKLTPRRLSDMFARLARLDLSNIRPAPAAKSERTKQPNLPDPPATVEVRVPISFASIDALIIKSRNALGASPPMPAVISRAYYMANRSTPALAGPSTNDLFNQILGLAPRPAQNYVPIFIATPDPTPPQPAVAGVDIIDLLTDSPQQIRPSARPSPLKTSTLSDPAPSRPGHIVLLVPPTERRRALVFLERVKSIIEQSPHKVLF